MEINKVNVEFELIDPKKSKAINLVNWHFNTDITKKTRKANTKQARHIFYYLMLENGYSQSELGRELNQSHSTVIHARETIENDMRYSVELRSDVKTMKECFNENNIKKH